VIENLCLVTVAVGQKYLVDQVKRVNAERAKLISTLIANGLEALTDFGVVVEHEVLGDDANVFAKRIEGRFVDYDEGRALKAVEVRVSSGKSLEI
jgi:hypothetical protein